VPSAAEPSRALSAPPSASASANRASLAAGGCASSSERGGRVADRGAADTRAPTAT
jgi:hypothetical protein